MLAHAVAGMFAGRPLSLSFGMVRPAPFQPGALPARLAEPAMQTPLESPCGCGNGRAAKACTAGGLAPFCGAGHCRLRSDSGALLQACLQMPRGCSETGAEEGQGKLSAGRLAGLLESLWTAGPSMPACRARQEGRGGAALRALPELPKKHRAAFAG